MIGTRRDEVRLHLPSDPSAAGVARGSVDGLGGSLHPRVSETVRLVVSELVTNAIRHAAAGEHDTIDLWIALTAESVRIEVADGGPGFHRPREPSPRGASGWGLFLVERLATRWGVMRDGQTRVWAEVSLTPPTRDR